jgi:hypothetical protein
VVEQIMPGSDGRAVVAGAPPAQCDEEEHHPDDRAGKRSVEDPDKDLTDK